MAVSKLSQIASGGATQGANDKVVAVRSGATDVLVTPVALDTAQTFTAAQTFQISALSTTPTAGVNLTNPTAAAASAQQYSPALVQQGSGWATGSGGSSQAVAFQSFVQPVQGTTNPTGNLVWQAAVNGGAYTTLLELNSQGQLVIQSGNIGSGGAGIVFSSSANAGIWATGSTLLFNSGEGSLFGISGSGSPFLGIASAAIVGWNNSGPSVSPSTYFSFISAGIIGVTSWIQNTGGEASLNSSFTNANATLTATNLSLTVIAGRRYRIEGYLIVSNSLAADGSQFDFNGGSATATTFDVAFSAVGSTVGGTQTGTALNSVLNYTTNTGTTRVFVRGYLKVNAAGTLVLRAAGNTDVSGTMTLAAGSWLALYDTVGM